MLCVDMDPQGNLTMSQGIDPDSLEQSMYDVLVHNVSIREVIRKREIDVACASIDLAGAEIAMAPMIGRERALQRAFEPILEDYDFICIDTPPSLGLLTINALTAADKVIVPVQCEYLSMRGLIQLQNTLSDDPREPQSRRRHRGHPADARGLADDPREGGDRDPRGELRGPRLRVADPQDGAFRRGARSRGCRCSSTTRTGVPRSPTAIWRRRCSMAGPNKRASMREGPLAALFRKTESRSRAGRARRAARRRARRCRPRQRRRHAARDRPAASRRSSRATRERPRPRRRSPRRRSGCAPPSAPSFPENMLEPPRPRRVDVYAAPTTAARPSGASISAAAAARRRRRRRPASTPSTAWSRPASPASSSSRSTPTSSRSQQSTADITVHIGAPVTRGLGSGADAGARADRGDGGVRQLKSLLKGSDMVFITAGAGGGTGTGAAPVVARIAREVGALTVGIVTKPFGFEGTQARRPGRGRDRRAGRRGRHADRRPQQPPAVGARQADLDGRGVPRRRRRPAPGRPGGLRPRHAARA